MRRSDETSLQKRGSGGIPPNWLKPLSTGTCCERLFRASRNSLGSTQGIAKTEEAYEVVQTPFYCRLRRSPFRRVRQPNRTCACDVEPIGHDGRAWREH